VHSYDNNAHLGGAMLIENDEDETIFLKK